MGLAARSMAPFPLQAPDLIGKRNSVRNCERGVCCPGYEDGSRRAILGRFRDMREMLQNLYRDEQGQDIAEYAVMLAVILVIVVGTIRLIGSNANNVFSQVASSIQ